MKTLGLFRHAKSDWGEQSARDYDRGLNDRGRQGARLMGRHIGEHGIAWDEVLASPAERVRRTIEASGLPWTPRWDERAYLASHEELIDLLQQIEGDPASVLLVGHNPGLQDLVLALVAPAQENAAFTNAAEKFPTASFAVLQLAIDEWGACTPGCARLVHFARPRDLDSTLGPDRSEVDSGL